MQETNRYKIISVNKTSGNMLSFKNYSDDAWLDALWLHFDRVYLITTQNITNVWMKAHFQY